MSSQAHIKSQFLWNRKKEAILAEQAGLEPIYTITNCSILYKSSDVAQLTT
jgi:hypothetical protein